MWYKTIKIAAPVALPSPQEKHYTDIGHAGGRVELWYINEDYQLFTQRIEDKIDGHFNWGMNTIKDKVIAYGRYDAHKDAYGKGVIAARMLSEKLRWSQQDYAKEKVTKILDDYYNNPRIAFFS